MTDKKNNNPPYPGLRPFFDDESAYFYGRDSQVKEIISRLSKVQFVAVLGGSGSGKSSLVRAGVIPSLRQHVIPSAGDFWIPIVMTPGTNLSSEDSAITRLSEAFCKCLKDLSTDEERNQRIEDCSLYLKGSGGLSALIEHYTSELKTPPGPKAENASFLFVFDQFEELFHPSNNDNGVHKEDRESFVDLIFQHVQSPHQRVFIVLTMRSEHLNDCATFLRLPDAINGASYLIRRLEPYEINQAIEAPIKYFQRIVLRESNDNKEFSNINNNLKRVEFDDDVLDRIHIDVAKLQANPDHLPLLQHLLNRVWAEAKNRTQPEFPEKIVMADFMQAISANNDDLIEGFDEETNSLQFCLENWSSKIYNSLDEERKQHVEKIFRNLAFKDPTTGMYTQERLDIDHAVKFLYEGKEKIYEQERLRKDFLALLESFMSPHEYVVEENNHIKVTHESFIRGWRLFKEWIDNESDRFEEYYALLTEYRTSKQNKTKFTLTENRINRISQLKVKDFFSKDKDRVNRLIKIKIKDQSWNNDIEKLPKVLDKYLLNKANDEITKAKKEKRWRVFKRGSVLIMFVLFALFSFYIKNNISENKYLAEIASYKIYEFPPIPDRNNSYHYKSIDEPGVFLKKINEEIITPYKQRYSRMEDLQSLAKNLFIDDNSQLPEINVQPRINKKIKNLLENAIWKSKKPEANLFSINKSSDLECYLYGAKGKGGFYSEDSGRGLIDFSNINQTIEFNIVKKNNGILSCESNGLQFPLPPEKYDPKVAVDATFNYLFLSLKDLRKPNGKARRLSVYRLTWPKGKQQRGVDLFHFMTLKVEETWEGNQIQVLKSIRDNKGGTIISFKDNYFKLFSGSPVIIRNSPLGLWDTLEKIEDENDLCEKLVGEKFKNSIIKEGKAILPEPFKSSTNLDFCYITLDQSVYIYPYPTDDDFTVQELSVFIKVNFGENLSAKKWLVGKPGSDYDGWIAFKNEGLVGLAWSTDALLKLIDVPQK